MKRPPSKPRTDTREAVRHLARAIRGLTHEISVLRRYVLELRAQHAPREYEVPPRNITPYYRNGCEGLGFYSTPNDATSSANEWPRL